MSAERTDAAQALAREVSRPEVFDCLARMEQAARRSAEVCDEIDGILARMAENDRQVLHAFASFRDGLDAIIGAQP